MKIISLQDIKEAFIRIKSLIGETLTSTVDAITEVENKIPKKVSQLENDTGFITDSEANTTYALSKSKATITLTGSDGSEYSETFTKSDIGLSNVPNVSTNNQVPTFSQASSRINIASGETLTVILGKIMRYFADLKGVAFSGSYNDLSSRPSLFSGSYNDLSNKPSLFSGNYNDLTNKPAIPSVGNGTLTIQRNGTKVQTFSANQSTAATANITVPNVSDSSSVTQTGTYALDAVEKNASVSGTLANAISQINSNLTKVSNKRSGVTIGSKFAGSFDVVVKNHVAYVTIELTPTGNSIAHGDILLSGLPRCELGVMFLSLTTVSGNYTAIMQSPNLDTIKMYYPSFVSSARIDCTVCYPTNV